MRQVRAILGLMLGLVSSSLAHSVWIEVDERGEQVDIRAGFGEFGAWESGYGDQVQRTTLEIQRSQGVASALKLSWDSNREIYAGTEKSGGAGAVRGECVWGVFGESDENAALLTFFPKAMFGPMNDWKLVKPSTSAKIEIVPSKMAGGVELLVLAEGKPLSGAKLKLFHPGAISSQKEEAGPDGKFQWKLKEAGRHAVVVIHRAEGESKHGDRSYRLLMHGAALTFENKLESASRR